ncbi:MAG: thiamine phosphate synthase [Acidimicrobiales bacterium]
MRYTRRAADVLAGRSLYLCTPDRPDLEEFLDACISGGVDVVQLREKDLDDAALLERATVAAAVCASSGVPFIVNDRPDIAVACGAAGVHVGQDDLPPAVVRRIVGAYSVVGLSTHSPSELEASVAEPVDYVSAGPVEATPTKPGRPGTGIGYVETATARAGRPVFVTGGVTPESVPALVAAGASRFVVVRYLTEAAHPAAAAAALRSAVDEAMAARQGP